MLIISKYKDYYDTATSNGIDKSIVYNRKLIEIFDIPNSLKKLNDGEFKFYSLFSRLKFKDQYGDLNNKSKYCEINPFIIGFCGKLYLGFRLLEKSKYGEKDYDVTYNYQRILSEIKDKKRSFDKYSVHQDIMNDINLVKNYQTNIDDTFRIFNSPSFLFDYDNNKYKITINPILKDYSFFKNFDSYLAFQEIFMFISGVLGVDNKKTIEISEENKITQHGFNKWSFRNPNPPKRKQKK